MPASRMTRITPLTAGFPIKALKSGRPSAAASAATSTRSSTIRSRKRREWLMPNRSSSPCHPPAAQRLPDQRSERQVQVIVGGEHVAGRHHLVPAGKIADITAGLADQQESGGDVPGLEAELPEPVKAAGGDIGEVEGGRAHSPHAAGSTHDRRQRIAVAGLS